MISFLIFSWIHFLQVTKANIEFMKQLVINGPDVHPGANFIEKKGQIRK